MQGDPRTMQAAPAYNDLGDEVRQFLAARLTACERAGIGRDRMAIDPGIGFGKSVDHNLELLAGLASFAGLQVPVLVGVSRKSVIGAITGRSVENRLAGGIAFATASVLSGASIIRAHDVPATVDAVKVAVALRAAGYSAKSGSQAGEK
jgi:dihydropteroate synthase